MSGQAHGHNDLPIEVQTSGGAMTAEPKTISPAQARLDHAVKWIAEHNCADKVLSITTIGRPSIHLDNIALLRQLLAGTGAKLLLTENGRRAQATFDGIDFVALDDPQGMAREVTL